MRILNYVAFRATMEQRAMLGALGVETLDCPNTSSTGDKRPPLIKLEADEANPNWPLVHRLLIEWDATPIIPHTEFTPRELDRALHLRLTAWDNGYPQPQEDRKFFDVTFDMTHCCQRCKLGKIQNAPFRIKGEPKWGRRGIMTLGWVFEELFVPPAIWETIFKPFGIPSRPVHNRRGKQLETVVQLIIEKQVDLDLQNLSVIEVCDACGRNKYTYSARGRYPQLAEELSGPIAKTRQAFGEGWGIRDIIVSQELRRAMISHKLRGADFTPVDSPLDAIEA